MGFWFFSFFSNFRLFTHSFFYFVPFLLLFLFKFFSPFLCLFLSTLACIISNYLSDVITESVCSINCFRFWLVVCFSGQTSTIFCCFFDWFFANCYIGMRWAGEFTSMRRDLRWLRCQKATVDIFCIEIYLFSRKDCLLSEIFAIVEKKKINLVFSFKPSFACVFFCHLPHCCLWE